jgi:hypothetical protein
MMRRERIFWMAPLALIGIALFTFIGGELVLHLWNWLLPSLFGWKPITFWQALGLLILCRILFGNVGMRGGDMRSRMRRRMAERWDRMTPEERNKFCQGLHGRWGREGEEPKVGV